jgi:glutathione S-transferase
MSDYTLITFPPSLDSEFSRFLLMHYRIGYQERRHTLIFSSFSTLRHGRSVRFPLLYGASLRLDRVQRMVDYFEPRSSAELRLVGVLADSPSPVTDWRYYHGTLATATTVFAYYHLLPHRQIMMGPLSDGAPPLEVAAVRRGYPIFAGSLRALLRLTAARARSAQDTIRLVMQAVDHQLSDGRRYLTGDQFTLVDLAFAVAAAPVVWPPEYGGSVPALSDTPPMIRSFVDEIRARPSGGFALRLFHEHRRPGRR